MINVLKMRKNRIYLYGVMAYMILSVCIYWDHFLDIMNTTVYAFSYQYGFMPRGVLGTFLYLFDRAVPYDAVSYNTIYLISEVATAIYFITILVFIIVVLSRVSDNHDTSAKAIMAVLVLLSVPMFLTEDNFGRLDVYLMIITLFCLILIILEKAEFLIIPAVIFATLIHEGFVFMNINIILVMLLYKCITKPEKSDKIKYAIILALTFILPSIVFLYCEFLKAPFGQDVFDQCLAVATKVSHNNDPHEEVLLHEILGFDVKDMELKNHIWNFEDTPIFLALFSPYIVFMVMVFRRYAKTAKTGVDKFISLIVLAGVLTLVPEIILKVDYGRYAYAILFYYLAIFTVLLALKDNRVELTVAHYKEVVLKHKVLSIIALLGLFVFIPFKGYRICDIVTWISEMIYGRIG